MGYCSESDVYDYSGLSSTLIQNLTGKSSSQVTSLINGFITKADQRIKKWIRIPIVVRRERHLADGEKRIFELGPHDSELELFDYNPQQGVCKINNKGPILAVYVGSYRVPLPYPKDCDMCENNSSSFGSSNCTLTDESNNIESLNVGDYCIKGVFSASGYLEYPSAQNLNKNIDAYDYVSFILQTSSASVTFTLRLYDKDGNYNYKSFTLPKADMRFFVHIKIDEMTGDIDWEDTNLYYWRLYADGACTIRLDGMAFNDGYIWTYPYGEVIHTETSTISTREGDDDVLGENTIIFVTYAYDPFLAEYNREGSYPPNIVSASARLAGAFAWDYVAGYVLADNKIRLSGDDLTPLPQRDVMLQMKNRLIAEAKEDISEYGWGYYGGVV